MVVVGSLVSPGTQFSVDAKPPYYAELAQRHNAGIAPVD